MATEQVTYIIKGKDQLGKTLTSLDKKSKKLDRSLQGVGRTASGKGQFGGALGGIKALNPALLGVAGAVAVVTGAFALGKKSLDAFNAQEQAIAQVRTGLLSTGGVAGKTLKELTDLATTLQRKTLFGDEEILQGATAQLLTFTKIAGKQFDRTQQAVLDLSTRMGTDLKSSAIQLGKALNDPVANLSALSRSGIQFSKSQKQVIKDLVASNRLAEAQTIILDELDTQFGGSAEAAAKAGTGAVKQLENSIGDILEIVGGAIAPVINSLAKSLDGFLIFIEDNIEGLKDVFAPLIDNIKRPFEIIFDIFRQLGEALGIASDETTSFADVFNILGNIISITTIPMKLLFNVIEFITTAIITAIKWVIDFAKSFEFVRNAIIIIPRLISGFVSLVTGQFEILKDNAINILGGLGDLLLGIFFFNPKKIAEGLSSLTKTAGTVAVESAKNFSKGFSEGLDIKDFFGAKPGEDAMEAGGFGALAPKPTAAATMAGGGVTGNVGADIRGAQGTKLTNITITIGKLVETLEISTTNLKESSSRIREEVARALLTAVNDINIISG